MHRLTPALISEMGDAYPELARAKAVIEATFEQEEERFQRTLGRGLTLLDGAISELPPKTPLPGETAFKLYDTYGFPLDLTQDILRGQGLTVDEAGFDKAMARQKDGSKGALSSATNDDASKKLWFDLADRLGATKFEGYDGTSGKGAVSAIIVDGKQRDALAGGGAELVFTQTPFYAESGGQAGDHGEITFENGARFVVRDVQKRAGGVHAHIGELVSGKITLQESPRADCRQSLGNTSDACRIARCFRRACQPKGITG